MPNENIVKHYPKGYLIKPNDFGRPVRTVRHFLKEKPDVSMRQSLQEMPSTNFIFWDLKSLDISFRKCLIKIILRGFKRETY